MNEQMNQGDGAQNQAPIETSSQDVPNTLREASVGQHSSGPMIGIIVIVLMLILGGYYFWSTKVDEVQQADTPTTIQPGGETEAVVNQLEEQDSSDEIASIEADLNATDLEAIDSELDDILNEF